MKIDIQAGMIYVFFDDFDFNHRNWQVMQARIKKIPNWDYDSVLKLWYVPDTPENREKVQQIYDDHCVDKSQITMF